MDSDRTADVIILGAGPAGAAAAIHCADRGLSTVLLQRSRADTGHVPGEALPPGIEPIMNQLGVGRAFRDAGFLRYPGHRIAWVGPPVFEAFGGDEDKPWFGFQALRAKLEAILLQRARALGAEIITAHATQPILSDGTVVGVETSVGPQGARFVVDATGGQRWLARALGAKSLQHSRRLVAWYAYHQDPSERTQTSPCLSADPGGWTWIAPVSPDVTQWVRLDLTGQKFDRKWCPEALRDCPSLQAVRGRDVTWRETKPTAGPGYFLAGDAAGVLDPLCGHGTLRAIMSGIMAGHAISRVLQNSFDPAQAAAEFSAWFAGWYRHDRAALCNFYAQQPNWDIRRLS